MKFTCDKCHTKYSISDEKVRGKVLKIRCKNCANIMVVREEKTSTPAIRSEKPPAKTGDLAKSEQKGRILQGPFGGPRGGAAAEPALNLASQPAPQPKGANAFLYQPTTLSVPPEFSKDEPKKDVGEWYLSVDGQQFGPMEYSELGSRIKRGEAPPDAFVWQDGFDDWLAITDVESLATFVPRTPPPPPQKRGEQAEGLPGFAADPNAMEATEPDPVTPSAPDTASGTLDSGLDIGALAQDALAPRPQPADPGPSLDALLGETPGKEPDKPQDEEPSSETEDSLGALLGLAGSATASAAAEPKAPVETSPLTGAPATTDKDLAEAKAAKEKAKAAEEKAKAKAAEEKAKADDKDGAAVLPAATATPDKPEPTVEPEEESSEKAAAVLPLPAVAAAEPAVAAAPAPSTPMAMKLAAGGGIIAGLAGVSLVIYFMAFDKGPQQQPTTSATAPKPTLAASPSLPMQTDDDDDDGKEMAFEPEQLSRTKGGEKAVKVAKKASPRAAAKTPGKVLTKEQKRLAALFGSKGVAKPTAAIPGAGPSAKRSSGPKQQIGPSQILAMQRKYKKSLKVCYERALKRDNSLSEAKAEVMLDVGISGMVKRATVSGVTNYQLKECLHRVVKRWYFANAGEQTVKFPLIFRGAS